MELPAEKIAELKGKYGEIAQVDLPEPAPVTVVVRMLTSAEFSKFEAQATSGNVQVKATVSKSMLQTAVVYPDPGELELLVQKYPGIPDSIGGEIMKLAGATLQAQTKKL